ncbi:MAG: PAS domain-containing protein [Alphaproteobacteria bacterium]|nr:PAS domain-containing protein [Alphaproteobacteria bacterium]
MHADDRNDIDKAATAIIHPGSRALFRYWEGLRAERPCPQRSEIALHKLVHLLPNVSIIERTIQGRWAYRLAGTQVCDLLHDSATGRDALSGFDSFERDVVGKTFELAVSRLQPCLVRMRLVATTGNVVAAELLGLPVLDQASGQAQLFGGLFGFGQDEEGSRSLLLRRELVSARMIWTEHEAGNQLVAQVGRKAPNLKVIQGGLAG